MTPRRSPAWLEKAHARYKKEASAKLDAEIAYNKEHPKSPAVGPFGFSTGN